MVFCVCIFMTGEGGCHRKERVTVNTQYNLLLHIIKCETFFSLPEIIQKHEICPKTKAAAVQ